MAKTNVSGVTLLGIPLDSNSSFARGPAAAPAAIRAALASDHGHKTTELGLDLKSADWKDGGDIDVSGADPIAEIEARAAAVATDGRKLLALGGDHSVSAPLIRAAAKAHGPLTVFHIDAHPDLYEDFGGNPASHASPFARALEAGAVARLVQVGVRTMNATLRKQVERYGVEVTTMRDWPRDVTSDLKGPLYVSLDLDGLDPAFAPAVSHPEPGGLSTREVLTMLQSLPVSPVAADLVELNPLRDINGMTAIVAAKCLKELMGRLLE
ncbi:MAG: agmatinase [Mesorhizobium sp.]|nr:agmatinase [Mesorhizobium sp.]MBN9243230.1 agmatinase [Mesorhizobium sp.]MBN9270411.1 agmatinase [Mesorhizobium sp.]